MKRKISLLLTMAAALSAVGQSQHCPISGQHHSEFAFSRVAIDLCFQNFAKRERHLEIAAPNPSVKLVVDGSKGTLFRDGRAVGQEIGIWTDEQWIWSPDSTAVMTTMIFGAEGPIKAGIGFVDSKTEIPDVMKVIQEDFARRHPKYACSKEADVAGLGWEQGSSKAVLVAEVPSSPHCEPNDGYFEAYVVSVPQGKILSNYSMAESIRRYRSLLGPQLRNAILETRDK